MRVLENPLCDPGSVRHRAGLPFRISLAATLFFTLVLFALPGFAQQTAPAPEAPPDATDRAEDERDEEEEVETDTAETAPAAGDPLDFAIEDPDAPVAIPDEDIEEILVKGSSQATKLDEPISIVQFGVEQMRAEGIRDIRDLSNFTPSLEIKSTFAATNPTIFIRGVGLDDFNANSVSAVAILQDGVYMNSGAGQLFGFFDLENVEVLRGPQGTLYRNASAGAILVNSQKPTDEFDAYVTSSYGRFDQIEVEAALGGPIIPDLLSGRLSGAWTIRDGIVKNRCADFSREELLALPDAHPCGQKTRADPNDPMSVVNPVIEEGLDDQTNDWDAWSGRAQLLLTIPPDFLEMDWLLSVHGGQNKSRALQFQNTGVKFRGFSMSDPDIEQPILPIGGLSCGNPPNTPAILCPDASGYADDDNDPFAGDYDVDGPENLDIFGGALTGHWVFGDGYDLESITGYEWHDRFTRENSDGGPRKLLTSVYTDTAWQVSQEFKLNGEWPQSDFGDGGWSLGAYYIQENLDVTNEYDQDGGLDLLQIYTQKMRNFAAYAFSEYKLQPGCAPVPCDFTLISGLRYNLEYKSFEIVACGAIEFSRQCLTTLGGAENNTWDGLSGEVSLAWHFYEDNSVYLKYARGWKGGHFNGGASGRFDLITGVNPEIVDSFESGIRSNWFDGRLMANVTGFYYDYQDLQVFQLEPTPSGFPIFQLVNANDALVYGVEIDLAAEPLPGLNITFNGSWVESEYLDFQVFIPFQRRIRPAPGQPFITINFDKEFDYSGNDLLASPKFSMTGSISYEIPLPGSIGTRGLGYLTPRFSYSWKDDIFHDASGGRGVQLNFPEGTFGQEAFWIFNASLAWRSENGGVEVVGWVRNFMDEIYRGQSFDLTRGFGLIQSVYADPRTYGMTVTLTF